MRSEFVLIYLYGFICVLTPKCRFSAALTKLLNFCENGFVRVQNFGERTGRKSKSPRRFFGIAACRCNDIENVCDELRVKFIGRLNVPHAAREFKL